MNVYAIKADGIYGGGMAIVAAKTPEEAMQLAAPLDRVWHTRYHKPESITALPVYYGGEPRVLISHETGE